MDLACDLLPIEVFWFIVLPYRQEQWPTRKIRTTATTRRYDFFVGAKHFFVRNSNRVPFLLQVKFVSKIAQPLASKKTTKKLHKLVKKASQAKFVRRGVKEVVKALRKGNKGFCIIAGDISPIDVVVHLPIMCEDRRIPYFYVPSKLDLGAAASTKRPTSCILVTPKDSFSEMSLYDKLFKEAQEALVQQNEK